MKTLEKTKVYFKANRFFTFLPTIPESLVITFMEEHNKCELKYEESRNIDGILSFDEMRQYKKGGQIYILMPYVNEKQGYKLNNAVRMNENNCVVYKEDEIFDFLKNFWFSKGCPEDLRPFEEELKAKWNAEFSGEQEMIIETDKYGGHNPGDHIYPKGQEWFYFLPDEMQEVIHETEKEYNVEIEKIHCVGNSEEGIYHRYIPNKDGFNDFLSKISGEYRMIAIFTQGYTQSITLYNLTYDINTIYDMVQVEGMMKRK